MMAQEKEHLVTKCNDEIKRREKHIKRLSDSVRHLEIENKHLLEVMYAKDKEVDQLRQHLRKFIINSSYAPNLILQDD